MRLTIMFTLLLVAFGCAKSSPEEPPKKEVPKKAVPEKAEPKPKSSVAIMIEGVTGKTAIDAGRKTEDKIKKIAAQHNEDLNEVLGE